MNNMKSCNRCYSVVSKRYNAKVIVVILDNTLVEHKNICWRCVNEFVIAKGYDVTNIEELE